MTDLISTPPAPASPSGSKVITGAWWPDIDVTKFRAGLNLSGTTIAHSRLIEAIAFAVVDITGELSAWQITQAAAGKASLAAVDPARVLTIDGVAQTELEILFLRAVSMQGAAELADRNRDITVSRAGADRAEERETMADEFRRDATRAVRAILGETGTMVDLI